MEENSAFEIVSEFYFWGGGKFLKMKQCWVGPGGACALWMVFQTSHCMLRNQTLRKQIDNHSNPISPKTDASAFFYFFFKQVKSDRIVGIVHGCGTLMSSHSAFIVSHILPVSSFCTYLMILKTNSDTWCKPSSLFIMIKTKLSSTSTFSSIFSMN